MSSFRFSFIEAEKVGTEGGTIVYQANIPTLAETRLTKEFYDRAKDQLEADDFIKKVLIKSATNHLLEKILTDVLKSNHYHYHYEKQHLWVNYHIPAGGILMLNPRDFHELVLKETEHASSRLALQYLGEYPPESCDYKKLMKIKGVSE
jgi:hypothetical protein